MIICLDKKAINSSLLYFIQVPAWFLEKRLDSLVRIVDHAFLPIYLPALVLKLSSIWIEKKSKLLITILGKLKLWLINLRNRRFVVFRRRDQLVKEEDKHTKQDSQRDTAARPRCWLVLTEREDLDIEN